MRSRMLAAMASGSSCRPRRKEPTVCPAGLGGRRSSRGGGGLALRSRSSASTPPMMLPAFFSRSYTCARFELKAYPIPWTPRRVAADDAAALLLQIRNLRTLLCSDPVHEPDT